MEGSKREREREKKLRTAVEHPHTRVGHSPSPSLDIVSSRWPKLELLLYTSHTFM